jgi:hypothetical protein
MGGAFIGTVTGVFSKVGVGRCNNDSNHSPDTGSDAQGPPGEVHGQLRDLFPVQYVSDYVWFASQSWCRSYGRNAIGDVSGVAIT